MVVEVVVPAKAKASCKEKKAREIISMTKVITTVKVGVSVMVSAAVGIEISLGLAILKGGSAVGLVADDFLEPDFLPGFFV